MVQLLYDAAYTAVALLALYIAVEIFTQVRLDLTFGPCKVCTDTLWSIATVQTVYQWYVVA